MNQNKPLSPLNDTDTLSREDALNTLTSVDRSKPPERNTQSQDQTTKNSSGEIRTATDQESYDDDRPGPQITHCEEQTELSEEQPLKPDYSTYSRVPVGFDRLMITYQLSSEEELLTDDMTFSLLNDQLRVDVKFHPYPVLSLSFNATTLNNKGHYLPLSLSEYAHNLQIIEAEMRWHVLPTFSIAQCNLFHVELFKTLHMAYRPFDYSKAISMLNVKGAYLKDLEYHSVGASTFSLKNGRHELMFYDKHIELKDKMKGKKEILDALPDKMMRIEWKLRKPVAIRSKLKIQSCFDLIDSYASMVENYIEHCGNILPEIPTPSDLQIDFTTSDMQAISDAMRKTYGKQAGTYAIEAKLAYYLVKENGLDNYYNTQKGNREQTNNLDARIKRWIPLVASIGPIKCIDLLNELRGGLLTTDELR